MYWAARGGHLEVLKWLHTNCKQTCGADTMDVAAKHGHLEVVKWLHANKTEGCTKNAMNGAAAGGHLEVVQWLHQNRSEGCGRYAMYDAAENNHFETVKWLYENCPRSHERTAVDRAFRSGHLRLACWLQQRFPEYEIGVELDLHKELVTVSGPWDSANAFEVLLCLHTCCEEVLTKWFLRRLQENIAYRENRSPGLLTNLLKQWLEEQYPESSE